MDSGLHQLVKLETGLYICLQAVKFSSLFRLPRAKHSFLLLIPDLFHLFLYPQLHLALLACSKSQGHLWDTMLKFQQVCPPSVFPIPITCDTTILFYSQLLSIFLLNCCSHNCCLVDKRPSNPAFCLHNSYICICELMSWPGWLQLVCLPAEEDCF